jgi:NAD(P)-dependent dehydrogenase (short-subunit alcohol dehydrogenase family)
MEGKTVLVTGATSGIGRATARRLADAGARVLGVGRNRSRCEAAQGEIAGSVFLLADLCSQADIRRLVEEVSALAPRLDVVIHNAGAMFRERGETPDGLERTFALNYLAPYLLTQLLLLNLRAAAPARVVNVASSAHFGVALDFDDLQSVDYSRNGWREYQRAKLALLLFTAEAARRLGGTGVTVHAVDPGTVATDFPRKAGLGLLRRLLVRLRSAPVELGAEAVFFCAVAPEAGETSGLYWVGGRSSKPSPNASEKTVAGRLWEVTGRLHGIAPWGS